MTSKTPQSRLFVPSIRGNKTPLELFLTGVRGWDVNLRRRMNDGKRANAAVSAGDESLLAREFHNCTLMTGPSTMMTAILVVPDVLNFA